MYSAFQACKKQLDDVQSIDFYLAKRLCQAIEPNESAEPNESTTVLFHSIMATTQALRDGHTCLKLEDEADKLYWSNVEDDKGGFLFPSFDEWHRYLTERTITPADKHPLVYDNKRLYLRRYWQFEEELGKTIRRLREQEIPLDISRGRQVIAELFPSPTNLKDKEAPLDWQKIAVANALGRQFTIIAGGPGTGKTFTVTKILAALQTLSDNTKRIAMVAPTGKAAQRLNESIQKAKVVLHRNKLATEETLKSIPDTASTIHRLLKVKMGSHNFQYNANNRLPFDVILVDEISMIDLPLMTRLMRAITPECQIIMLGDADQLPSVAAGSVLADLAPRQSLGYSPKVSQQLSELTGFDIPVNRLGDDNSDGNLNLDHLTLLQHSHRFEGGGEIGQLAKHVISGNAKLSWDLLAQGEKQIEKIQGPEMSRWIEKMVEQYHFPLFFSTDLLPKKVPKKAQANSEKLTVTEAFKQLNKFRFLAATRLGSQGVAQINETVEQYLRSKGKIETDSEFYPGRPIMVTENHYHVGLYNGDTGILWEREDGKLAAAFPQVNSKPSSPAKESENTENEGSVRWLSLGRLPAVETVYAMTIHKTQGSEFAHVGLVLPENDSLILSRELLYTGITRASDKLSVWADKGIWTAGVKRKVQRYSGLPQRVFGI